MKRVFKLLIGYDGSRSAEEALQGLKKAGLPDATRAHVLSAADVFLPVRRYTKIPEALKGTIMRYRTEARKQVRLTERHAVAAQTKIKSMFPKWTVTHGVYADSPAWALIKKAKTWKANLILVGSGGHSKLGRFFGSVSQMVLTQAESSVRIGRPIHTPEKQAPRILIGIDGSQNSGTAFQHVLKRAWKSGTQISLLAVIDPKKSSFIDRLSPPDLQWFLRQADDEESLTRTLLESYAKQLREKSILATCEVQTGDPKEILVKKALSLDADCIVVGARGLSHLKRFFIGGVSAAVASRAHCSVEVVRE